MSAARPELPEVENQMTQNQTPRMYQRRKILVDRSFQLRFILRVGGLLFFYFLLFLMISLVGPVGISLVGNPADEVMMETAFRVEVLLRLVLPPLACTFLCILAHGIFETFRIAGPSFRFRQVFRDLQQLRVPRGVRIRKDDYMQDTCEAFHQALVTVHDTLASLQADSRTLSRSLESGRQELTPGAEQAARRMEATLAQFQLLTAAPECRPVPAPYAVGEEGEPASEEPVEPLAVVGAGTDESSL